MGRPKYILPIIILSQFAGTSLWFAGNAILSDIAGEVHLSAGIIASITSSVQFGFITGTFVFALLAIADRFSPSRVFFVCSLLGAATNACVGLVYVTEASLLILRFLTGFFLAGIYPVGMKIAADWYEKGLGKALGFLVGALVLGTAFPHLLKGTSHHFEWRAVTYTISAVAFAGGCLLFFFIPDGPYRKKGQAFSLPAITSIFRSKEFSAAAIGYFGHMWELYAFWAFVPVLIRLHEQYRGVSYNVPLWSFIIIGIGSIGCVGGGYISQKTGNAKVAFYALLSSGMCCVLSYLLVPSASWMFFTFMIIWGITVIADSPQFSTLVAQTAPADQKGTALTLVTSIGFGITIASIQLINYLLLQYPGNHIIFVILAIGPVIGLKILYKLIQSK